MRKFNLKFGGFACGALLGLTSLSFALASVPSHVTDDTAIYQKLSEIRVSPEKELNFDSDIARLTAAQHRFKEKLPVLAKNARIQRPMSRILQKKYQYSSKRATQPRQPVVR